MLTVLTTTLLLASLVQDAEPTAAAAAPAPSHDPKAMEILDEFAEMLYSPEADGLKTLAFDMVLPGPGGAGSAGTLSVAWDAREGASGSFAMSDMMKTMMKTQVPEAMLSTVMDQMNSQMNLMANQIAAIQTNNILDESLDGRQARLAGVEDGFVKVECEALPGTEGGNRSLYFEDGLLTKTRQTVMSPMGQEVESVGVLNWAPMSADSEDLVMTSTDETSAGQTQSSSFVRERVGGFVFVTAIKASVMGQSQEMPFTNFVVNGKPSKAEQKEAAAAGEAREG